MFLAYHIAAQNQGLAVEAHPEHQSELVVAFGPIILYTSSFVIKQNIIFKCHSYMLPFYTLIWMYGSHL